MRTSASPTQRHSNSSCGNFSVRRRSPFSPTLLSVYRAEFRGRCEIESAQGRRAMDRGLRLRHGASGRFRRGQQSARKIKPTIRKMERLRLRPGHGSAGDDFVRHSRYQLFRAERFAVSETVRMKFSVNWLRPVCRSSKKSGSDRRIADSRGH